MIHGLLISNHAETVDLAGRLVRQSGQMVLDRCCAALPGLYEVTTTLQTLAIDVALIDLSEADAAAVAVEHLSANFPRIAIVGLSIASRDESARLTEYKLALPLSAENLLSTTRAAMSANQKRYPGMIAFLPAKAGCGASTTAMNVAARLAESSREVVLLEADIRSGAIGECLGLVPRVPVADTLSAADTATQLIWPMHVAQAQGVDCLLTNREATAARPEWHSYFHLLRFLASRYDNIVVDLPELVNDATSFVLQHAARVFVTTTPETLSLKLAQQRLRELKMAGVEPKNVGVVLNRWQRGWMSAEEISAFLGCSVDVVVPNEYRIIAKAIQDSTFVPAKSKLGQAYSTLTAKLDSNRQVAKQEAPVRSFSRWGFSRNESAA